MSSCVRLCLDNILSSNKSYYSAGQHTDIFIVCNIIIYVYHYNIGTSLTKISVNPTGIVTENL